MSTRGVIARPIADGWEGRYHHQDSNPTGLGRALWQLYHAQFGRDIAAMTHTLLDEHPAGWSTIIDADWTQPAGFRAIRGNGPRPPACYCHGDRSESPELYHEHGSCSEETCTPAAIVWVYVLSGEGMAILRSRGGQHVPVQFFRWSGPEPEWARLVEGSGIDDGPAAD